MGLDPLGKLLLLVDTSEESVVAAECAIVLARWHGAVLHALYVVNEQLVEDLARARVLLADEALDLRHDLERDGRYHLAHVGRLAHAKGLEVVAELRRGMVHREAVRYAEEVGAGLVVVGGFDEPRTRRECYYNDTERILWTAPCPVLVVRGAATVHQWYQTLPPRSEGS